MSANQSATLPGGTSAEALVQRMRRGDREAAAEFLQAYGAQIRRRIRGKLGPGMRRIFDSQEILSTLGRRLDQFVSARRLEASSLPQLWGLVFRIADNSLIEKARVYRSLQAREGEDSPLAHRMLERLRDASKTGPDAEELEIDRALRALHDPIDREILALWLNGQPQNAIAGCVGLSHAAVRKRWQTIRGRLRSLYDAGNL